MKKLALAITVIIVATTIVGLSSAGVVTAQEETFPEVIPLPDGFRPEGVVVGRGHDFYAGSLADGRIYKGDLRTGEGGVLVEGETGNVAVGLAYDSRSNYLFVAGGPTGKASVYDADTGQEIAVYDLPVATNTFVNDVVVTRSAAYFTDSFAAQFYVLPLSARGTLPDASQVEAVALGGDFEQEDGFNANGIDATPNGKELVIVNSTTGKLFRVDPDTGNATLIDLGGDTVTSGDGILLDGKTLYVVQNFLNQIAVVQLDSKLTSGEVVEIITDSDFDVPTTIAEFGSDLYAVNARFTTPPQPTTEYDVVRVSKR